MRTRHCVTGLQIAIVAQLCFGVIALRESAAQEKPTDVYIMEKPDLIRLIKDARDELLKANLSHQEVKLRMKIVQNVATVKAYFPHVIGGPPEYRDENYWVENRDGCFVPKDRPSEAIKNLWVTISGVRCHKLSTLVMLKGLIDVSGPKQIAKLDNLLKDKVIPNDLENEGVGLFFDIHSPKNGEAFQAGEFLPGDEVWFENPYFNRLEEGQQSRFYGQEGHHVFYVGGGNLMDMYSREPMEIEDFRRTFLRWATVRIVAERDRHRPNAHEFQIKEVRRVKTNCLSE